MVTAEIYARNVPGAHETLPNAGMPRPNAFEINVRLGQPLPFLSHGARDEPTFPLWVSNRTLREWIWGFLIVALLTAAVAGMNYYWAAPGGLYAAIREGCWTQSSMSRDGCENRPGVLLGLIAIVLCFYAIVLLQRRPVARIVIRILKANDPFPIVHPRRTNRYRHFMAVRVLEPNVERRLHEYLATTPQPIILTNNQPLDLSRLGAQHTAFVRRRLMRGALHSHLVPVANDFWPIIRLVLDRTLYRARYKDLMRSGPELANSYEPRERTPQNQIHFSARMHAPQLACFLFLTAIGIALSAVIEDPQPVQYTALLGGSIFLWAVLSIQFHRRQLEELLRWSQRWQVAKPLGHCPIYYYDPANDSNARWELLADPDFNLPIDRFGLDHQSLLNALCGILVIGFLGFLQIIK